MVSLQEENSENGNELAFEQFDQEDEDNCSPHEVVRDFKRRYIEVGSVKCSTYASCSSILASNVNMDIGVIMSDKNLCILDTKTFKVKTSFQPHQKLITDMKFSSSNPNNVYTSSIDGFVKIWDLRTKESVNVLFADKNNDKIKPLSAFGISSDERILCAGTELIGEDAFLLFWDLRGKTLLGGYWESHSDDITCVKFHPDDSNILGTSGSDNLLNIFDISLSSEDDALTYVLNTEDIVNTFEWVEGHKKRKILALTDVHSLQFWDIEECSPDYTFSRDSLTKSLKRSISYECYNVPLYSTFVDKNPLILAGSGLEHESGPSSLRTLRLNVENGSLEADGLFVSSDEADLSAIILGGIHFNKEDIFITSKDNGFVSVWKSVSKFDKKKGKSVSKFKKKYKINPY